MIDTCVAIVLASTLGVWALVAGSLAGAAGVTILSYVLAPHAPRLLFRTRAAIPLMQFGQWVFGTSVIGLIASGGVQFVISRRLGVTELGLYFLATKVAFMPADAATTVLGSVAFPLYLIDATRRRTDEAGTAHIVNGAGTRPLSRLHPDDCRCTVGCGGARAALGGNGAPLIRLIAFAAVLGLYADATLPLHMGRGQPDRAMMVVGTQTGVLLGLLLPLIAALGVTGAAAAWLPAYVLRTARQPPVRQTDNRYSSLAGAGRQLLGILGAAVAAGASATVVQAWVGGIAGIAAGLLCGVLIGGLLLIVLLRRMNLDVRAWLRPAVTESAA